MKVSLLNRVRRYYLPRVSRVPRVHAILFFFIFFFLNSFLPRASKSIPNLRVFLSCQKNYRSHCSFLHLCTRHMEYCWVLTRNRTVHIPIEFLSAKRKPSRDISSLWLDLHKSDTFQPTKCCVATVIIPPIEDDFRNRRGNFPRNRISTERISIYIHGLYLIQFHIRLCYVVTLYLVMKDLFRRTGGRKISIK